jgi:signal transduction histidine kinase
MNASLFSSLSNICTKLKSQKVNRRTVTPRGKKLRIDASPANLLGSLTQSKILQKEPKAFISALAHEVRDPLSTINLAVEMLRSITRDEDRKLYLDVITRSSSRINDLVINLLLFHRPSVRQSEEYSMIQLIEEALSGIKDRIMLKNITVRKDYTTLDCKILVNKQEMIIALTNIITNATDAMASERGKLKLITKSINGKCVIEIEDNGIGISKENLKNIFKPYFTNKLGGMGLGLSATLDILQSNHAKVEVRSEEGKGTRFILSFEGIKP